MCGNPVRENLKEIHILSSKTWQPKPNSLFLCGKDWLYTYVYWIQCLIKCTSLGSIKRVGVMTFLTIERGGWVKE